MLERSDEDLSRICCVVSSARAGDEGQRAMGGGRQEGGGGGGEGAGYAVTIASGHRDGHRAEALAPPPARPGARAEWSRGGHGEITGRSRGTWREARVVHLGEDVRDLRSFSPFELHPRQQHVVRVCARLQPGGGRAPQQGSHLFH